MATAESSAAPAARGDSIVLEAHQGTRKLLVTLHYAAVRELREMLNGPSAEFSGVLLGRWTGDEIALEHAAAQASAADAVGVFRVLPGGSAALIPADCKKLQTTGLARGLVLVVRTPAQRPWSATLFAAEGESAGPGTPLAEFPWDEYLLRNGWLLDLAPPQPRPPPATRRWNQFATAAALFLVSGAGGAAAYRLLPSLWHSPRVETASDTEPAPVSPALSLKVVRQSQDVEVSWDRRSDLVEQASAGTLTIRSGAATRVVKMRPEQLQEGRVVFRPLVGVDTDVRLDVMDVRGKSASESVQVLGFDTAAAVGLPAAPAPAPSPAPPDNAGRKTVPQQTADRQDAVSAGLPKAGAAVALPSAGQKEAVAVHRATPDLTRDVINEMHAAKGKVTVSVLVSVDTSGKVDDVKVVSSSGEPSPSGPYIRLASLKAARQWRFRPATADGKPVATQMTLLFTF